MGNYFVVLCADNSEKIKEVVKEILQKHPDTYLKTNSELTDINMLIIKNLALELELTRLQTIFAKEGKVV
jgi:hypothetical protein